MAVTIGLNLGKALTLITPSLTLLVGKLLLVTIVFVVTLVSSCNRTHMISISNDKERQTTIPESGRDIVVGQGVWISSNVTVLGPYKIGDNSVIGDNFTSKQGYTPLIQYTVESLPAY